MMPSPKSPLKPKRKLRFEAIGTQWEILSADDLSKVAPAIMERIEAFDAVYSRFREDSLVSAMARKAGCYTLPDDAIKLIEFYHRLYAVSGGKVTPLIGSVMEQAGYDAQYSLVTKEVETPPQWEAVLQFEAPVLQLTQPALLDFGAAGKGYLVDIVGALLTEHGVNNFSINAGGDILVSGDARDVGLENPLNFEEVVGIARVQNGALCGSAGSRRTWGEYHHTIDPHALTSPDTFDAVWVSAATAMEADGLATALYFVAPNILQKSFDFEYAYIKKGRLFCTDNFDAEFFSA